MNAPFKMRGWSPLTQKKKYTLEEWTATQKSLTDIGMGHYKTKAGFEKSGMSKTHPDYIKVSQQLEQSNIDLESHGTKHPSWGDGSN